ncbi:pentapeptide repeat-containing protein [Catenulispora pinisilvae]|uniref:pentapeptide repeat-containing protein n=1 Tax=Catenulispora pinisilvae TaxID=2705253 RepID=UPI0018925B83|nr:pentapeptide repeat-containing protein [Catenulispora pinisilvae]
MDALYQQTADRLARADADGQRSALQELEILAREDPAQRQPIADTVCRYLREPAESTGSTGSSGSNSSTGSTGSESADSADESATAREQAVALLAALARQHPEVAAASADIPCDIDCEHCLDLELDGAVLPDVDFSGCRLGDVGFTDTHFRGTSVFAGARFAKVAMFQRSVFEADASFAGARFSRTVDFGRARFRADADFSRVRFQDIAWFGRGETTIWEDDEEFWEVMENRRPVAWDELNEDDPNWPMAELMGDYQTWEEGGDGTRFNHRVSFADAEFAAEAWFWKARFGDAVSFQRCSFGGRVHLIQPAVDLTGARLTADARAKGQEWPEGQDWPFGWITESELEADGGALVVHDDSLSPYRRQLADADPDVRLSGLHILGELGDAEPALRERITETVCAYLRTPLSFDVTTSVFELTPSQFAELRTRHAAQRLLTDRTRPALGRTFWEGIALQLSGATLIDFDASDCRLADGDFTGTQFYGKTSFAGAVFGDKPSFFGPQISFALPGGGSGRAAFHGPVDFSGLAARKSGIVRCRFHTDSAVRAAGTDQDLIRVLLGARIDTDPSKVTVEFQQALGAENPHVEYGVVPGPADAPWEARTGLKVTGTDVLLTEVAGRLDGADAFPQLSPEQWAAATGIIRALLEALETR